MKLELKRKERNLTIILHTRLCMWQTLLRSSLAFFILRVVSMEMLIEEA